MITVRALTQFPELNLRVLAGHAGLSRKVRWAHVSELRDPTPWLEGGELVMTVGMAVPKDSEQQSAYLTQLASKKIAGLAIGDRRVLGKQVDAPVLTPSLLETANRLPVPLLLVTGGTPFMAIAQRVAAANRDLIHYRLATHLRLYEVLSDALWSKIAPAQLAQRLSKISGYRLYGLTRFGKPIFPDLPTPPFEIEPDDLDGILQHRDLVRRMLPDESGERHEVFLLPIYAYQRPVGVLVAQINEGADTDRLVLSHISTILGLHSVESLHEREREQREANERFALLAADDGVAVESLFSAAARCCVVAFDSKDGAPDTRELCFRLDEHALEYVLAPQPPVTLLAIALDEGTRPEQVAELLEEACPTCTAGLTVARPESSLAEARRDATWALRAALGAGRRVQVFEDGLEPGWLPAEPSDLEFLASRILGPLTAYDARTGSDLEHTLRVYLEEQRSLKAAAARLAIHRQTLVYRLSRIEELTRVDVHSTSGICDLWLALRAREILGRDAPARGRAGA